MSIHDPHPSLMACIDLETTGLDEQTGLVLEVAARVVTNDLTPIDTGLSFIVAQDDSTSAFPWQGRMNDFVTQMHTESGLISDIETMGVLSVSEVDARVASYLHGRADGAPLLLVGNSITLDRNFLREHLPLTFAKLHHRSVDLTSVELFLARYSGLDIKRVAPSTGHRAMDDVDACLATGRNIGDTVQAVLAAVDRS